MREIKFTVPGEPKSKQRPRVTKRGIAYTPKQTVEYENWVKCCYIMNYSNVQLEGQLKATIIAYFSVPKSKSKKVKQKMLAGEMRPQKLDCDNIAKVILDALNKLAYHDDKQVVELIVEKYYADVPRVEAEIESLAS